MLAKKESKATVVKILTELEETAAEHSGNFSKELEKYKNQSELTIMITEMKTVLEGIQAS